MLQSQVLENSVKQGFLNKYNKPLSFKILQYITKLNSACLYMYNIQYINLYVLL